MASENAAIFRTPTADDPALAEVVRRLVAAYKPERIYLFGSVARGEGGPDSDYDLMVIVPDNAPRELRDCDLAYRVLRGLGIAKDVLIWTRSEFEKRLHLRASLPSAILREGRLLHAA
jgi:predicted nucleotidyltransferase